MASRRAAFSANTSLIATFYSIFIILIVHTVGPTVKQRKIEKHTMNMHQNTLELKTKLAIAYS